MHELGIAEAILEAVRAEAERHPGQRLLKVGVRVGELAGVDPEALDFSFASLLAGSGLASLRLEIESSPRRQRCPECAHTFPVIEYETDCPACGAANTQMVGGDELELAYVEVEDL